MNRLKELRKSKGYTLDDITEKTGIKRGTYNNYENGKTEPKLAVWKKLADFFNVSIDYLVGNAPTIKMTRQQATIFAEYWDKDTPIDTKTFDYPESEIMKDFKNRQLAQAWLYPETIRVVDK